jgi:hypothetical protein
VLRRQDGQIIPALVMVMVALLVVGMLFFQVGRAAIFSTEAQTAADAAALAGAKDVERQLMEQVAVSGMSDIGLIDSAAVQAAAEGYASKNGAHVVRLDRNGADVKVWVSTDATLGKGARALNREDTHGLAHARARVELTLMGGGGANIGPEVTGGDPTISQKEWDKLKERISSPPTCNDSKNDMVPLGELLRAHGFNVAENADLGSPPAPNVHVNGSYHYRCHSSAAIDVNHDQGDEGGTLDALVAPLHALGYRTIWRAAGHFDHMHIDVANSPSIGEGFSSGGAVGGLEETGLTVKLIDWNAAYEPFAFTGFGGGGTYGGAPDPGVAHAICGVLDHLHAPPIVRLSAFEAAIVESGVHNLNYGDRDSLGVYQQRWTQGWGTPAQIMNPVYAATQFISRAIATAPLGGSAGQIAQRVQRSAYPARYDQVAIQAASMLTKFCGG